MGKLIYTHMVSLDGFIETDKPYDGENWAIANDELTRHFLDFEADIEAHLYGRRVFEAVAAGWPNFAKQPGMPPLVVDYANLWINKPKVVFSTTLDHVDWNARLVKAAAAEEVAKLKTAAAKDLTLYGSVLAASLIEHQLVDELCFYINPVLLNSGVPVVAPLTKLVRLRLDTTETFGCGVVMLRYTCLY